MNFISILEVDEVAEGLLASAGAEIQVTIFYIGFQ